MERLMVQGFTVFVGKHCETTANSQIQAAEDWMSLITGAEKDERIDD